MASVFSAGAPVFSDAHIADVRQWTGWKPVERAGPCGLCDQRDGTRTVTVGVFGVDPNDETVGVLTVGVLTVGVLTVGAFTFTAVVLTVGVVIVDVLATGVLTVGVLTVGVFELVIVDWLAASDAEAMKPITVMTGMSCLKIFISLAPNAD